MVNMLDLNQFPSILEGHEERYPEGQCFPGPRWCAPDNIFSCIYSYCDLHLEPARTFSEIDLHEIAYFLYRPFASSSRRNCRAHVVLIMIQKFSIYSCGQTKSSNLLTDFLGLWKASELVDNGINEFLLISLINSNGQNFQK